MRRSITVALIITLLLLLAPTALVVAAEPTLPHQFYGTVKVRTTETGTNVDAPLGTTVVAKVDGVEKGRITVTTPGKYGGPTLAEGKLLVSDVAGKGNPIQFYINETCLADVPPGGWPGFEPEEIDELNLTAYCPLPPPARPAAGGGGGGPPAPRLEVNVEGEVVTYPITTEGKILTAVEGASEDGCLLFSIAWGTFALDEEGNPLGFIETSVDESPPSPPEGANIIGLAYSFEPSGATFDPPMDLSFCYDPADIPEGVAEEDLVLAYYDEEAGKWVVLECVVDTENNRITASISHFTTLAKIAWLAAPPPPPPAPVAFSVSKLSVQPAEVKPGETVTITVSVANTGGTEETYTVILMINGVKEAEKGVTLAAGKSKDVTFSVTRKEAGSYTVAVERLSGSFTVTAPPKPVPPAKPPINWPLLGGIIAAVVVVGLLIYFLAVRRRAY